MKTRPPVALCLLLAALAAASSGSADEKAAPPDPAEILKAIDAALFFPDAQPGLSGYACDASALEEGRKDPIPLAKIRFDAAAGTTTWTDAKGNDVVPGTWDPPCGPWRLADLLRIEWALFSSPLSSRFDAARWDRTAVDLADGTMLSFVAREVPGGTAARPTVAQVVLKVGKDRVPVSGGVHLRGGSMAVLDAAFDLRFEAEGALRRLASIENSLANGTLAARATLVLSWEKVDGFPLPKSVSLSMPLQDVFGKPTGLSTDRVVASTLSFGGYVVKQAAGPAPKPEAVKPPAEPSPAGGPGPKYVGDKACMKCHFIQHKSWKKGPLAHSLATLAPTTEVGDAALFAKKKAAGLDPAKDHSADPACVKCHVTGYGEPSGYPQDPAVSEEAKALAEVLGKVSCEACHGPGEAYIAFKQKQAAANVPVSVEDLLTRGLRVPDEKSCRACHNGEGPTKETFSFEEAKARVHEHKKKP